MNRQHRKELLHSGGSIRILIQNSQVALNKKSSPETGRGPVKRSDRRLFPELQKEAEHDKEDELVTALYQEP